MKPFTYTYQGEARSSNFEYYMDEGSHRYRVKLKDTDCVITPMPYPGPNHRIIWAQSVKPGEVVQPHDLMQAIGEGIEKVF